MDEIYSQEKIQEEYVYVLEKTRGIRDIVLRPHCEYALDDGG